jgi:diazepam-binding inhibitor (GABA receptor modulating acyl-CoA-binding protein)
MATEEEFMAAVSRIKSVTGISPADQLTLYALFKQATAGDASGARPGVLDVRGRAKHDAWATKRGMSMTDARNQYIALVTKLAT